MKRIWIPQTIAGVMLLWALNPENPYGYYTVLRLVCCAAFTYLALKAHAQGKEGWVWVLGVMAVIYNPIIRIHLTREIWSAINIATLVVAISSIFVIRTSPAPAGGTRNHLNSASPDEVAARNLP
jgi:FtsH-binding integral membrane protein